MSVVVMIMVFGAPILSEGMITDSEVLQPFSGGCATCCCCLAAFGVIAGLIIAVFEPREAILK